MPRSGSTGFAAQRHSRALQRAAVMAAAAGVTLPGMERRRFLTLLAAGTAATLGVEYGQLVSDRLGARALDGAAPPTPGRYPSAGKDHQASAAAGPPEVIVSDVAADPTRGVAKVRPASVATSSPPSAVPVHPTAAPSALDRIPGTGVPLFALTIDDGTSTPVLDAYLDFVIASGIRMTFFVNGVYQSWTVLRRKLAPLVESGQVQLGNHTWNHPSISKLSSREIVDQLQRNERFLRNTYGVDGRPYFRPPYGDHNAVTDRITGALGYDRTVMWYGSLGDATAITPAQLLAAATQWFRPRHIVIGHANHPAVTYVFPQLADLIRNRHLQTVTLRDVFGDKPIASESRFQAAPPLPSSLPR
jgi:peptidoglycan/xylan/chitin deacetylase (PgdA/CDA1 family)